MFVKQIGELRDKSGFGAGRSVEGQLSQLSQGREYLLCHGRTNGQNLGRKIEIQLLNRQRGGSHEGGEVDETNLQRRQVSSKEIQILFQTGKAEGKALARIHNQTQVMMHLLEGIFYLRQVGILLGQLRNLERHCRQRP